MTPKEKADYLVNYMYAANQPYTFEPEPAKWCAIVAVDELIKEHTLKSPISWNNERKRYWKEVKQEIEKL